MTLVHRSVLLEPTVAALVDPSFEARRWAQNPDIQGLVDGVYVDCTFGRGGHSRLLLSHLSSQARLIVIDKDPQAGSRLYIAVLVIWPRLWTSWMWGHCRAS